MMSSKKVSPSTKRKKDFPDTICIAHVSGLKYGEFELLSTTIDPKDRLNKLIDIHRRREAEPPGSAYCMNASCNLIPDVLEERHGYHLVCYWRFTANLD